MPSENNTELELRSNLGVPTCFSVKSFSVSICVSVILILTLKPYLSVGVKPGIMQMPTKHQFLNEMKLRPSITLTSSIYFNLGLMKGFSVSSGVREENPGCVPLRKNIPFYHGKLLFAMVK
jgi:hypothetical protein